MSEKDVITIARGRGIYNRIFSEDKWKQVNKVNKDIMEDFLTEYRQQKKAESTIHAYFEDLRLVLIKILEDFENKSILEMSKKDFRRLNIWFDDSGMSPARCNRIHSVINSLLTFCENDDDYDYDVNQSKKVKGVPREKVKTNDDDFFFTYNEFIQVRDILVAQGDLQTAVMWSIFFDSGARRNEVYQIKKDGLLDGNKTNIVRGKRGKMFPLVYLNDTKELIRQYLEERGDDDIESLWVSYRGKVKKPLVNSDVLYDRILKCSQILSQIRGEETNIFPHTCRHSRIECLLRGEDDRLKDENGKNRKFTIEEVMVFVHHSDISTTQSYAKDRSEETINSMFGIS